MFRLSPQEPRLIAIAAPLLFALGCIQIAPAPAPLFTSTLFIDGEPVGPAVIDTGGAYEVILREPFGLELLGETYVLAFGGVESVQMTEGFHYSVNGVDAESDTALVGLSTCDCNGLGFIFFRKTGKSLSINFQTLTAEFIDAAPFEGVQIPFRAPPVTLPNFDSAFLEVTVTSGEEEMVLLGLLDTGTNGTVMRRGLFSDAPLQERRDIRVQRPELGTVAVNVGLFDTPGLPDIVLGTDVMGAWADRWYFTYNSRGGFITVVPTPTSDSNTVTPSS